MTALAPELPLQSPLAAGFGDPVRDAQAVFRKLLDAMAHPGRVVPMPSRCEAPPPLQPSAACVALALLDHETPVWLAPELDCEPVREFLRFHCSCPLVAEPRAARFALIGEAASMRGFAAFAPGSAEQPEASTTLVIGVPGFSAGPPVSLSGPGIATTTVLCVDGLDPEFWVRWQENAARFPCGVDVVFAGPEAVAALPRSVRVEI